MESGIIFTCHKIFPKAAALLSWNWCVNNRYGCHIILWFYLFPHKYGINTMQQKWMRNIHSASVLFSLKLNTNGTYLYVIQISIFRLALIINPFDVIHTHLFLNNKKWVYSILKSVTNQILRPSVLKIKQNIWGSSWFWGANIKVCRNST